MTHDEMADFTAYYLKNNGWHVAFSNMTDACAGEQPDALGIDIYGNSILCEIKTSRADFLSDQNKWHRKDPEMGIGDYRVYVAPKGLLSVEDIPYGWMLWEVYGQKRSMMRVVKGRKKVKNKHAVYGWETYVKTFVNTTKEEYYHFRDRNKDYRKEMDWLLKVIRRAEDEGIDMNLYSKGPVARQRYLGES